MASTTLPSAAPELDTTPRLPALAGVESPRGIRILTRLLMALLLIVAVGLFIIPWQQNISGQGRVVAFDPNERQQVLQSRIDGRVRKVHVVEGDLLREGDPIIEITDNDPEILVRLQDQKTALLNKRNAGSDSVDRLAGAIAATRREADAAIEAARNNLEAATQKVRAARQKRAQIEAELDQVAINFGRQEQLHKDGLASRYDLEIAERSHKTALAKLQEAEADVEATIQDEAAKRAKIGEVEAKYDSTIQKSESELEKGRGSLAEIDKELRELDIKLNRQQNQLVTAPRDGTVFRVLANREAEFVKAGAPLVVFVPTTDRRSVELWVDGNDQPLIRSGDKVRLQFEGWPAVQFAGWPSVAVGTFGGVVELIDSHDDGKGRFRLLIAPDVADAPWPKGQFLRQGVRANGWVLLRQVPLWYELWRQLNAFPPTIAMDEAQAATGGKEKPGK